MTERRHSELTPGGRQTSQKDFQPAVRENSVTFELRWWQVSNFLFHAEVPDVKK